MFLFLEDFTRYAHGIVSEYLPLELSEELKAKCGYVTDTSPTRHGTLQLLVEQRVCVVHALIHASSAERVSICACIAASNLHST